MDFQTIVQFISTLGFPIAVCLICFWYINKKDEQQKEELKQLADAIENNTKIMEKLYERIGGKGNGPEDGCADRQGSH